MRNLFITCLLMSAQLTAQSQQRIFIYPSEEGIVIKGFDTTAPYMDYYPAKNASPKKQLY